MPGGQASVSAAAGNTSTFNTTFNATVVADLAGGLSTEARFGATLAVVVTTVALWLLVAAGVRRIFWAAYQRITYIEADPETVDVGRLPSVRLVVGAIQITLVAAAATVLLALWGYAGVAFALVGAAVALFPDLVRLVITAGLVVGAVFATRLLEARLEEYAEGPGSFDRHEEGIVFRVLQVVLFTAVALSVLSLWNVNLEGLLVGAGFLGIVVGLAARQTLGALIAGFVLMFSRPFEIGDWIEVDSREGIVTDITIINTRIRNFDDETVVLPNDRVTNATVVNRTERNRLRVRTRVGVDYGTDLDHAVEVAEEAVRGVDRVMRVPAPQIVPVEFADSAVVIELRFWIDKPSSRRRWQARAAVIRAVKEAFEAEGIKIPFPQRELSGRAETGGFEIAGGEGSGPPEE